MPLPARHDPAGDEEAVTALRRVLYLDQGFVLAHFSLGNLSQAQGNRAEARRHLRNALELLGKYRPDDPLPHSEGIAAGRMAEIVTSALERMGAQV